MGNVGKVDVTGVATLILAANTRRTSFYMFNNGANRVFLGETAAQATVAEGFPLESFSQFSEDEGNNIYKGDIYGITAGTTEGVRYWERTQSA
jgi:cellulase/cellobiase CelA1